jgi:hypothetical protein
MGVTAAIITAAATVGSAASQASQAKKARQSAESQAALERQALADLQTEPEPVMPTADDEATARAKRRSIASQMRRRGRQSTILTDPASTEPLGGA